MGSQIPESIYYARHLRLPGFSAATQQRLRQARVLIVGVGGLGCPAALYLACAGVGTIALCDADDVSATNLHRQVLFEVSDLGRSKVDAAAARLKRVNPHIHIETIARFADAEWLSRSVRNYDLVLDGTDNFRAKYSINDACEAAGVPLVHGSIFQFEGQVSVFHHPSPEYPDGLSYRDLYPEAPPAGLAQNCGEAGVVGVLPGIIGTMQANEAIKVITGLGETLSGFLLIFDALSACTRRLALAPRDRTAAAAPTVNLTCAQWLQMQSSHQPPVLVDVRELHERAGGSLGGMHIPLADLPRRLDELPANRNLLVYCQSGLRSAKAALYLQGLRPGTMVFNLEGGVDACTGTGSVCAGQCIPPAAAQR